MANVTNDKPAADSPEVRLSVLSDVAERVANFLRTESIVADPSMAVVMTRLAEQLVNATLFPAPFPVTGTRVSLKVQSQSHPDSVRVGTVTHVTRMRGANLVTVAWDDPMPLDDKISFRGEMLLWNNKAGLPKPGVPSPESTAKTVNRTGSFPALKIDHRRSGS